MNKIEIINNELKYTLHCEIAYTTTYTIDLSQFEIDDDTDLEGLNDQIYDWVWETYGDSGYPIKDTENIKQTISNVEGAFDEGFDGDVADNESILQRYKIWKKAKQRDDRIDEILAD
jgi:hypothetical protein